MALYAGDEEIRSKMVGALQRWWHDNAGGSLPDRSSFEPFAFKKLLPNLLILDVEHNPFRLRFRLVGTMVVEATGLEITGSYLDELVSAEDVDQWVHDYRMAYDLRKPVYGTRTVTTMTGARFVYEFGLFPLRKGSEAIDQFFAVEDYFGFTNMFHDLPEWRKQETA